ncbi:MAG: 4Fe-4S dicluster domain-containing protein [Thermoguttaceae bacterium]
MTQTISRNDLYQLIEFLRTSGHSICGPVAAESKHFFMPIKSDDVIANTLVLDSNIRTTNSIKEFFFPQHETICHYCYNGKNLEITDAPAFEGEQIIFGVRPCDAASLPILDHVFAWDFQDRFFQDRRKQSTVVTLACKNHDAHCFCTSVGLAPDSTKGADVMLLEIDADTFEVRCFTEKGTKLFAGKTSESTQTGIVSTPPPHRFDVKKVTAYLAEHFDETASADMSIRCVGCGACTYLCPTCHCFDIVDEGGALKGKRVKNWDSCQFTMFTHHASGHNPRGDQMSRQRNRIQHKFVIYPEKFGEVLCTGCGNCSRQCSVFLGICPHLEQIDQKATS